MRSLNQRIRRNYEALMLPAGRILKRTGISANWFSLAAVGLAAFAGLGFATQRLALGLLLLIGSVVVDMVDGSVARASGRAGPFGMVIDHTTDRYAEFFWILGLCLGGYAPFWLGLVTLFSMLMPSYVRAKVESSGIGISSQGVGIAERKEKVTILIVSLVLAFRFEDAVGYGFGVISVISQISAFERLWHAYRRKDDCET